ncbi:hypothetical protein FB451DRAFT_1527572 [Mycena latifolia]|nr:hypothetical protein FB451DRAFT_1527572 [Mycena latifolia]
MSTLSAAEFRAVALILGPWMIGSSLDLFLQGVLSCQFVNYYTWYSGDKGHLRIIVGFLALGTYLKSIQAFAVVWIKFVVYFGDLEGAMILSFTAWWESGNALMVAAIGLYVQTYFCYRLWVISMRWYVVAPIHLLCVFGFLAIAVVIHLVALQDTLRIPPWFAAHMASVFVGDILLTLTTAYFLINSRKDVLPQTAGLISALIRLTLQTAAPSTFCAMIYLIFSQINIPTGTPTPSSIMTVFNMPLPKLYAISMMWTLNARRSIRAHSTHRNISNTSNEISGGRSRQPQGDVELSRIQCRKCCMGEK